MAALQAIQSCCPPDSSSRTAPANTSAGQPVRASPLDTDSNPLDELRVHIVQGPPGTGKTHLICGIVSCWLHENDTAAAAEAAECAAVTGGPHGGNLPDLELSGAEPSGWSKRKKKQQQAKKNGEGVGARIPARRVLICAQSNAGVWSVQIL